MEGKIALLPWEVWVVRQPQLVTYLVRVAEQSEVSRGHSTISTRDEMARTEQLGRTNNYAVHLLCGSRQSERTYLKEDMVNPMGDLKRVE